MLLSGNWVSIHVCTANMYHIHVCRYTCRIEFYTPSGFARLDHNELRSACSDARPNNHTVFRKEDIIQAVIHGLHENTVLVYHVHTRMILYFAASYVQLLCGRMIDVYSTW